MDVYSQDKINVLMLNYEFPPLGGGAGNANYYILKEFAKYPELKVDLVTASESKFRIEKFSDNIEIHYLDIYKNSSNLQYQTNQNILNYTIKAYCYARKLKNYTLCHAFFGIPCGFIAMKLKLPYIISLRGSDVPFNNKRFYFLDKLVFKGLSKKIWDNAKIVVANSNGLKELAQRTAPTQGIMVIHNGVDLNQFTPMDEKKLGERIRLISVGRLIESKGYLFLLEAMKSLKNVELILIGDGNQLGRLKEQAFKNNVKVIFLGQIEHDQVAVYLREADVFVLPSLNEGMPNAILEAMACGLPIIATDTGGSQELITDNGYIIEKASIKALERAISIYLNDHVLINEHGSRSRLYAERMSWNNIAKEYREAYLNCI